MEQLILFGLVIVVLIIFMVRNGRKRAKDQATLAATLVPGAEVMTTFGLYGTIVSIDEEENKVVLRTSPNSEVTLHRQAVGRVVTPVETPEGPVEGDDTPKTITLNGEPMESAEPPAYGERLATEPTKKPTD